MTLRLPAEGKIVDSDGRWTPDFRGFMQGLLPATGLSKDEIIRLKDVVKKFYGGGSEPDISGYIDSQAGISINGNEVSKITTGSGIVVDKVSDGSVTMNTVPGGLMVYGSTIPPASRSNVQSNGSLPITNVYAVPYYFPTRTFINAIYIGIFRDPPVSSGEQEFFSLGLYSNKRTDFGDLPYRRIVSGTSWVRNETSGWFSGENFITVNSTIEPGVYWQVFNAMTVMNYAIYKILWKTDATSTAQTGAGTTSSGANIIALVRSGTSLLDDESGESWGFETTMAPYLYYR